MKIKIDNKAVGIWAWTLLDRNFDNSDNQAVILAGLTEVTFGWIWDEL